MLEYQITARRENEHTSVVHCKATEITIDTDINGRTDAFNPAELLLAAVAACILKNIERVAPMIHFNYQGVSIEIHAQRQDTPPRISHIDYKIIVDTDENERKLALLHHNIQKFGTIYNTISDATELQGSLVRHDQQ